MTQHTLAPTQPEVVHQEEGAQEHQDSVEQQDNEQFKANSEPDSLLNLAEDESNQIDEGVKPEDLPDELWDADNNSFKADALYKEYQTLSKRVKGLREKLSKGEHKAPKKKEDYKVEFNNEELAQVVKEDDPLIEKFREAAHKNNISPDAFNEIVNDVTGFLAENKENFGPSEDQIREYQEQEIKKLGPSGKKIINAVASWGKSLYDQGQLSESDLGALSSMTSSAEQVQLLNKFRSWMGQKQDVYVDATGSDNLPSDNEIFDMFKNEKYLNDSSYRNKVDDLIAKRNKVRPDPHLKV